MERQERLLYGKSLKFLGMRLRSVEEMRKKLVVWLTQSDYAEEAKEVDFALLERVIDQLQRDRFLDDERFAREWVISRLKNGKRGPAVIKMELSHKGVNQELIRKTLTEVESIEDGVGADEGALQAGEKYLRKLRGKEPREQKMKLYAHLHGKGFAPSSIRFALEQLVR